MKDNWIKKTFETLYNEFFGEKVERPLLRRALAFLVDYVVLTPFLAVVSFVFVRDFEMILIFDFPITVLYFTILNSKHFGGQTIGKRIFKLQVVDQQGELIGFWKSLLRSLPVSVAINSITIHLIVLELSATPLYEVTEIALAFTIIGLLYFPLIKLNRQSIHDLIVSTQVVSRGTNAITTRHLNPRVILGYLVVTSLLIAYIFRLI